MLLSSLLILLTVDMSRAMQTYLRPEVGAGSFHMTVSEVSGTE